VLFSVLSKFTCRKITPSQPRRTQSSLGWPILYNIFKVPPIKRQSLLIKRLLLETMTFVFCNL
jgi:hypothetical protein